MYSKENFWIRLNQYFIRKTLNYDPYVHFLRENAIPFANVITKKKFHYNLVGHLRND